VGALVLPEGQYSFYQTFVGGAQESGRRAGTENVPGIVGLSVALSEASLENGSLCRQRILRGRLFAGLLQEVGGVVLNGNLERSVPNILNVSFEGINGGSLVSMLSNLYGIYCSTGSACQSGESVPSHILTSMGVAPDLALGAVRFSISKYTTEEEIEKTISAIKKCASDLR
jgi:cysteine desulfurase